jgi:ferrous iron transport protein B
MTVAEATSCCARPAALRGTAWQSKSDAAGPPVIALVGRPNVGKSTFFGQVSGRFAETANVPGTTVSIARREIEIDGGPAQIVDLPGTLSLADQSDGLPAFWQLLLEARPDAILAIVDAGDLARHLPLVLACRDLGLPLVVAANLADEAAARGIEVDVGRLSQLLVAPVFRTIGRRGVGTRAAVSAAVGLARARRARRGTRRAVAPPPYAPRTVRAAQAIAGRLAVGETSSATVPDDLGREVASGRLSPIGAATIIAAETLEPERWAVAERWAGRVESRDSVPEPLADRLGRLATAPLPGVPLFAAVTVIALLATMAFGTFLAGLLGQAWAGFVSPGLVASVNTVVPFAPLANALLWALDSGLLSMLSVGIPFVLSFYVIIAVLEDSGYLAAAAVLTDRLLNAFGLPGRAMIPILAATGCNVPAIYGTRVLDTRRERLLASFLIVLTPCSARSAVVIAALAPFVGAVAALAAFGVVILVTITAGVAANALVPGRQSPLVLELPPLRMPIARQVASKAWFRFRSFVRTATPLMVVGSFSLGLAYEFGALGPIEAVLSPVTTGLLSLPSVTGLALVLGFLRKELALQLLIVLAIGRYGGSASNLATFMTSGQLFVFAVVTAISIPCVATLASLKGEFGWRSTLAISAALLGTAVATGALLARLVG